MIQSASVEANGWVLRLTGTWGASDFPLFTLSPDTAPGLSLALTRPGYDRANGVAVANAAKAVTMAATKPLRLPTNPATPNARVLDEASNGDGTRTVRIALSNSVYQTDSALMLSAAAGWRTGEPAGSVAVTNGSTRTHPLVIARWATVPYRRVGGMFRVDLLVAAHFPQGTDAVAAVRYTVTDGTTSKVQWVTAVSNSTEPDGLRCWGAAIDPTGLRPGLITVHADLYPWTGVVRSTGAAQGTGTSSFGHAAMTGHVVAYDPPTTAQATAGWDMGARYGVTVGANTWPYVVVPVSPAGTVTTPATAAAAQAMIGTGRTLAEATANAKLIAAAGMAGNAGVAISVLYRLARTAAAANGGAALSLMCDGATIAFMAGAHTHGGTALTGVTSTETWVTLCGDPLDVNARTDVSLTVASSAAGLRLSRLRWKDFTFLIGGGNASGGTYNWLDNLEITGKDSASQTAGSPPITQTPPAGQFNGYATRCRLWKSGWSFGGAPIRWGLLRTCVASRTAYSAVAVGVSRISDPAITPDQAGLSDPLDNGDAGSQSDVIVWGCDMRGLGNGDGVTWNGFTSGGRTAVTRAAVVNSVFEKAFSSNDPVFRMGAATLPLDGLDLLYENSDFIGDRVNAWYNDPQVASAADTDTVAGSYTGVVVRQCYFDYIVCKHDQFADPLVASLRAGAGRTGAAATGYRPFLTQGWSALWGVDFEGVVDGGRFLYPRNLGLEWGGLRYATNPNPSSDTVYGDLTWPKFTADQSDYGAPTTGFGNYKPLAGSPLLGRGLRANIDTDGSGATRVTPFATGGIEGAPAVAVTVAPNKATQSHSAAAGMASWSGVLPGSGARQAQLATAGALGWAGQLAAAGARQAEAARMSGLGWTAALGPAGARQPQRAGQPAALWSAALLPMYARQAETAGAVSLGLAGALAPDGGRLPMVAALDGLGWRAVLSSNAAQMGSSAAGGGLLWAGGLSPDPARQAGMAAVCRLSATSPGATFTKRALKVGPDPRTTDVSLG